MGYTTSRVVRALRTKFINTTAAAVLIISGVGFAAPLLSSQKAAAAGSTIPVCASCTTTTIQSALAAATAGDTIDVQENQVVATNITINKQITLTSSTNATIDATGANQAFTITAAGTTVQNLTFTAGLANTAVIGIQASDVTIDNNYFSGMYTHGASQVSRGLVVSSYSNIAITNNEFHDIRQPAYINDNATGVISGNFVETTKGFVVVANSNFAFTNNSWGAGADRNAIDIAIIPGTPNNYDAAILSANNNGAVVDDQVVGGPGTPHSFTTVYVDGSVATSGDGTWINPFKTVQEGINATVAGGTVNVAAGTYTANQFLVLSGKEITIKGAGAGTTFMQLSAVSDGFKVQANNVTLEDFTISTTGVANYGLRAQNITNLTVNNVNVIGMVKSGFDFNGVTNSQFTNLVALNNGGNGISITDSRDLTFTNTTTNGNGWGGIAMYANGNYYPCGINNIVFNGTTSIGETRALYTGIDNPTNPACTVTGVTIPVSLTYKVTLDRDDPQTIYVKSAADAALIAAAFSTDSPVITNLYPPTPPAGGNGGSTGGSGSSSSTTTTAAPATTTTHIAYYDGNGDAVAYDDGAVIADDQENTADTGEVKGESTKDSNKGDLKKKTAEAEDSAFLGLGWWWIPVVLVGLGIIYWAVVKRSDSTSSTS